MKKILVIALGILALDQEIKIFITSNLSLNSSQNIIPNFFNLTYVQNEGAAFSTFLGGRYFLIIMAFVALILIYHYLIKNQKQTRLSIAMNSLLIGGIIGNMIDRIVRGYVVDYLDFTLFHYQFPIFNLADICIVISCFMIVATMIKEDSHGNQSNRRKSK